MRIGRYVCQWCGEEFEASRPALYCNGSHRVAAFRDRRDRDAAEALDAAQAAVAELMAHVGAPTSATKRTAFVSPDLIALVESTFADARAALLRRP